MKSNTIRWVLIGLLIVAGIYLIVDHGQHITSYLPFVFLSGCLFMHLFMHGGHGSHYEHKQDDAKQ
jgi:hypothetical protein